MDQQEAAKQRFERYKTYLLEAYKDKPELARKSFQWRVCELMQKFGRTWVPTPLDERSVKRGLENACYANAAVLAMEHPSLTYVEGYSDWLEHAWCVDSKRNVVDPTLPKDLAPHPVPGCLTLW